MNKVIILFMIIINSQLALANIDSLEIGQPIYGGNGCPQGSAQIYLDSENSSLDMRFNSYIAEAGNRNSKLARKTCNLAIPLHLPSGYSVSVIQIDYRGLIALPKKATADFNTEYFFAGEQGLKAKKSFLGPLNGEFNLSNQVVLESMQWSKCGEDTILRVNTSLLLKTNRKNEEAAIMVDSATLNSGVIYHLNLKKCE